jgi:hypothetical protein
MEVARIASSNCVITVEDVFRLIELGSLLPVPFLWYRKPLLVVQPV